eukprot:6188353-Pleurochrysis_carterae.AAC.2
MSEGMRSFKVILPSRPSEGMRSFEVILLCEAKPARRLRRTAQLSQMLSVTFTHSQMLRAYCATQPTQLFLTVCARVHPVFL